MQVFADRYERASLLVTSDLPLPDWGQVFHGERMTAALLDHLAHRCDIFDMSGESSRFRVTAARGRGRRANGQDPATAEENR